MPVLKFVLESGKEVEFLPHETTRFEVRPLGFDELVHAAQSPSPVLQLEILNASASSEQTGLSLDGPLTVRTTWAGNGPVQVFGLVEGGWLPLPWAHKKIALLDRNVVIALEKAKAEQIEAGNGPTPFAQLLGLDSELVSPMLFALEGAEGRAPTELAMRTELRRAERALQQLSSGAGVELLSTRRRRGLRRMVLDHSEQRLRGERLLLRAVPLVVNRAKRERRLSVERDVMRMAREEKVHSHSLVVFALLSCIYDGHHSLPAHRVATPGRAVIKPSTRFSDKDAYNAMADLFFVELMSNVLALFRDMPPVLYTRDIGLASFWSALQPMTLEVEPRLNGKVVTSGTFQLARLFPALQEDELAELKQRLSSY